MTYLSLRVRTDQTSKTFSKIPELTSFIELKQLIEQAFGIPADRMTLLTGFPPTPLPATDDATLFLLGVKSGETLIVKERSTPVKDDTQTLGVSSELGFLHRQKVPANNSCLFTSIFFLQKGELDLDVSYALREHIAQVVAEDPQLYNPVFLEKPNDEYCMWIRQNDTWGGGIEIKILGDYYKKEIVVIDILRQTIVQFGQDRNFSERVFLAYDGLHYDPVVLKTQNGELKTTFSTDNDEILIMAQQLASKIFESRDFRSNNQFLLICQDCDSPIRGHFDAKEHARQTGHAHFSEIKKL